MILSLYGTDCATAQFPVRPLRAIAYDEADEFADSRDQIMLSPRRKTALIAGAVFLVLGGVAIHASPMSASVLEDRLQGAADEAIHERFHWLHEYHAQACSTPVPPTRCYA